VERLRTLADDCPIDAGGRTVHWLGAVTPAESLRFLESLTRADRVDRFSMDTRRNTANAAVTAISLHRDPAADATLDRLAATGDLRRQAAQALASTRGAHGFATVQKLAAAERDPDMRRALVGALGQTRETGTAEALRPYLKDADANIRAEAIYWFVQRGGAGVISEVTKLVEAETHDNVRRRGISGLSRLPANDSIPVLLQLARSSPNPVVRKEAVRVLSDSKDPRAMALMEELIKR
jgi:HEAT repeat protein